MKKTKARNGELLRGKREIVWLKIEELKGGPELIELYRKIEDIILAGPHVPWHDYKKDDEKAAPYFKAYHEQYQKIFELNNLDKNLKWTMYPPSYDHGFILAAITS